MEAKEKKDRLFSDYNEFRDFVGLLDDAELFEGLGIKPDGDHGEFEFNRLPELKRFCERNPNYHIATATTDFDDVCGGFCTIDNCIRFVNRMDYYLAYGSKDAAFVSEICEERAERDRAEGFYAES